MLSLCETFRRKHRCNISCTFTNQMKVCTGLMDYGNVSEARCIVGMEMSVGLNTSRIMQIMFWISGFLRKLKDFEALISIRETSRVGLSLSQTVSLHFLSVFIAICMQAQCNVHVTRRRRRRSLPSLTCAVLTVCASGRKMYFEVL